MKIEELRNIICGNLIISCQALKGEPLYIEGDTIMPYMARAAKQAGACAIRTNGAMDVRAIKAETNLPVIALLKRVYEGYEPYITPSMKEVDELVEAGAEIIAFDATNRKRVDGLSVEAFVENIRNKYPGLLLMADVSNFEEGIRASKAGVDLVSSTLSGYTSYTQLLDGPDFQLVEELAKTLSIPVVAEGKIHTPEQAARMLDLGATSVVVGGAITRPLEIAMRFITKIKER